MFFQRSAAALALSFLTVNVLAQDADSPAVDCPYKPKWYTCKGTNPDPRGTPYSSFECATIPVIKDYTKPNTDDNQMPLNLIRYPAKQSVKATAESIIVNFGGPGISGIQELIDQGVTLSNRVNNELHIVSFDPRGVGINNPYNCAPKTPFTGSNDYFSDEVNINNFATAALARAKECDTQNPDEGMQVGSIAVAKDVRQMAYAMGVKDKNIRYWGFSYGTILGDTIAKLFNNNIASMVLDGNINPNDYWFDFPVEEASNIDAAIRNFFRLCEGAKTACAWNVGGTQTYDQMIAKWDKWVGATPEERGTSAVTLSIDESYLVRDLMLDGIKFGFRFIKAANILQDWYENKGKIASVNFDKYTDPGNPNVPVVKRQYTTDNDGNFAPEKSEAANGEALLAITGADNGFRRDPINGETYLKWVKAYFEKSKYGGDISIMNLWKYAPWVPRSAEVFAANDRFANIQTSPGQIVFVQTPFDPVTPSQSGYAAYLAFTNSVLITSQAVGHCPDDSSLLTNALRDYFTSDGETVPPNGTDYELDALKRNPFIVQPSSGGNNVEQDVAADGEVEQDSNTAQNKRDLAQLFPVLARRAMLRRAGDDDILTCEDDNNSTTTTTTGLYNNGTTTRKSTMTGSTYTTTRAGAGKTTVAGWGQWSTVTTPKRTSTYPKETGTWGQWSTTSADPTWSTWSSQAAPSSTAWQTWDNGSPKVTKYVYVVVDICPTGLATSTVTVTATCDKSKACGDKPAVPTGYKTTEVYCSACATPSKVTVTVKVTETATWSAWDGSSVKPTSTGSWAEWSVSSAKVSSTGTWADWQATSSPVKASSSGQWNNWGSATASGPIAKYTGGANSNNVVRGGLYVAVAAAVFVL